MFQAPLVPTFGSLPPVTGPPPSPHHPIGPPPPPPPSSLPGLSGGHCPGNSSGMLDGKPGNPVNLSSNQAPSSSMGSMNPSIPTGTLAQSLVHSLAQSIMIPQSSSMSLSIHPSSSSSNTPIHNNRCHSSPSPPTTSTGKENSNNGPQASSSILAPIITVNHPHNQVCSQAPIENMKYGSSNNPEKNDSQSLKNLFSIQVIN